MRNKKNKPKYPLLYSGTFCLTTGMDMAKLPRIFILCQWSLR